MPLADQSGFIALFLEHLPQGHLLDAHRFESHVGVDRSRALVVPAGEQGGPGGGTERLCIKVGEANRFAGQAVHDGSLNVRIPVNAHIPPALVVGQNQDDIGTGVR